MRSKSESGMTLDRINRYVEVANVIFMDNETNKTCYNTEIHRVARLEIMDIHTTEPHYPCQNKAENVINIIKEKSKRRRVQRNIPKRDWDFGMVWESDIHYHTVGKDGRPDPERLTGDTIDISECLES